MKNFATLINNLNKFWESESATVVPAHDIEMGAGTFHPLSVFGPLKKKNIRFSTVQPCRRPGDSNVGSGPNRFTKFHQYQVILKPSIEPIVPLFLRSLESIGFNLQNHQIDFIEGQWDSPTLGAHGLGWEVRCDGMEICQITYFSLLGNIKISSPTLEFAYGIERLFLKFNEIENLDSSNFSNTISMNDFMVLEKDLKQISEKKTYDDKLLNIFADQTEELINNGLIFAAYDACLKLNNEFNNLDGVNYFSLEEKRIWIKKIQDFFAKICASYTH